MSSLSETKDAADCEDTNRLIMYKESFAWVNGNPFPRTQTKSPQQFSFPQNLKSRPPTSKQDNTNAAKSGHHEIRFPFHTTLTWNERTVRQHLPHITE